MTGSGSGWASGFGAALGTVEGGRTATAMEVAVEVIVVVVIEGGGGREGREGTAVFSSSTTRSKLVCCPCDSSSPLSLLGLLRWGSGDGVRCFPAEFLRGFGTGRFASLVVWEVETGGGGAWEVGGA